MTREIQYNEAILEATDLAMARDPKVYVMGLGVPDPKAIFGTLSGLAEKYGPSRIMDMPTSENAMTGIAIGSAIRGMKPIMTHQRVDFFLLALDQLINNAAKWHYMFANQMRVPLVIRLIMGRGWGQGPQHSQSLQSIFAHIPGLKVVMPSSPYDAKGLLLSAIEDENPIIFLEHRWLHNLYGPVPKEIYTVPLGKAKIVLEGTDVTIVATSHMVLEAYRAAKLLEQNGISVELIDPRTITPLDRQTIFSSIEKTGRLIVADPDWKFAGFGAEIVAQCVEERLACFRCAPVRIAYPDRLCPTSWVLSNHFYPGAKQIACEVLKMMNQPVRAKQLLEELLKQSKQQPLDVPDKEFTGPF